jgi:hypothetical protein
LSGFESVKLALSDWEDQVTQKNSWAVSVDGQQMTLTTTGTLETGQNLTEKLVFKKQ